MFSLREILLATTYEEQIIAQQVTKRQTITSQENQTVQVSHNLIFYSEANFYSDYSRTNKCYCFKR